MAGLDTRLQKLERVALERHQELVALVADMESKPACVQVTMLAVLCQMGLYVRHSIEREMPRAWTCPHDR